MKKRLAVLLVVLSLLLTSCQAVQNVFGKKTSPEEFDAFMEDFFREQITQDALTLHYFIQKPEDFGIESFEDTLGTLEPDESKRTEAQDLLAEVKAFNDNALSEQQRHDKQTLEWYLETAVMVEDPKFDYYQELAAPMYGVQSNLPINFANYGFNEERDVEHYLALLDDVPRYMEALFAYEKERADRGMGMTDYLIDQVISDCQEFLGDSLEENVLITTFSERLETLGVTGQKAEEWISSNRDKVENKVFPAYQDFMKNMETLKGMAKGTGSLAEFEHGKEYYEFLARNASSSERSIEEMKQLLNDHINSIYTELYAIMARNPDIFDKMTSPDYGAGTPEEILEMIADRMGGELVPAIDNATYTVRYVPKSLESSSNPAFCFIPQIDNIQSSIYINQSPEYEHMDFFITVAHEGYPGHMYQNTYYYRTQPAHIRHILDFSGYTEGWAVYISHKALALSDINDEDLEALLGMDQTIGYAMSALADIGVNYEGWDLKQLTDFFGGYGVSEEEMEDLYNQLVSTPAVYLSYSIGELEFLELREYAEQKMGDKFNDVAFHEIILKEGPTSFSILKQRIDEYQ